MSIVKLIKFEEGWRSRPYLCSENYPTVGYGFKLGPQGADIALYDFVLPRSVGDAWLLEWVQTIEKNMRSNVVMRQVLTRCNDAQKAVLISMAYQMGLAGLLKFKKTLVYIGMGRMTDAASEMLNSEWARKTPMRAKRHSVQFKTGHWCPEY